MAIRPGQLAFMPSGSIDLTLRGRDAYSVGPQGQLIPRQPEAGMRRITPASGITASTAPTPGFGDVIARQAAARLQAANRMRAQQMARQQQPAAPAPTFGQRVGTALRQPLTSPTGMGLATAALTGLEMAGPQPVPTSTGQILARAGMAGLQAYAQGKEAEAAREAAEAEAKALADYRAAQLDIRRQELDVRRATAEATAKAAAGKAVGFENESKLRKEYDKSSADFKEAKLGFEKVQNAATSDPSGANDLALIFGYMKVLDPGSVVREGEFANAQNTGGISERVWSLYNQLLRGERLTPGQRTNFIQSARTQFAPSLAQQAANEDRYRGLSDAYGFKSENVVTSYLPKKGSRTNPHVFETEQDAEQSGLKGFAYIGGRLAEIK